jgi:hypothetical protein
MRKRQVQELEQRFADQPVLVALGGHVNTGLGLLEIHGDGCYYG